MTNGPLDIEATNTTERRTSMTRTAALKLILSKLILRTTEEPDTGCWVWFGATTPDGCGEIRDESRSEKFCHRLALIARCLDLDGLVVHHHCRNRACWRPAHLTQLTNSAHSLHHAAERRREKTGETG